MQGYLLFRTIHNLLRAVLISKNCEDFLLPSIPVWMFPRRIFQKSFDVDETRQIFGLTVFPQQFDPMSMPEACENPTTNP